MLWDWRRKRLVLPASMGGILRHGRFPEHSRLVRHNELGLATKPADRLRERCATRKEPRLIDGLNTHTTGSAGFVAINNADSSWTATFATSLPAGAYCDVISGSANAGTCSGLS